MFKFLGVITVCLLGLLVACIVPGIGFGIYHLISPTSEALQVVMTLCLFVVCAPISLWVAIAAFALSLTLIGSILKA